MVNTLILISILLCALIFINVMMVPEFEGNLESYSASFSSKTKAGGTNVKTDHGKKTYNVKTNFKQEKLLHNLFTSRKKTKTIHKPHLIPLKL